MNARVTLIASLTLLAIALARALVAFDPFPGFSGDPSTLFIPVTTLTPAASFLFDALAALAALAVFLSIGARGSPRWWEISLFTLALACAAFHIYAVPERSLDGTMHASLWITSALAALALSRASVAFPELRRIALVALISVAAVVVLKGLAQVFIEHPAMMRSFRANRESILAASGWTPESVQARAYERRLSQPEATGWFGLANVAGTFFAVLAASLTTAVAAAVGRRITTPRAILLLGLGALAGALGLYLAGSKGAAAAAALGVIVGLILTRSPESLRTKLNTLSPALLPAAVLLALFAIGLRGILGDSLGELSLRFRAFYIDAAWRITLDHLPAGIGPANFQAAYMLAKNPISPEDVISPHSVLLDWSSALGLGGIALGLLWLTWLWAAGRSTRTDEPAPTEDTRRLAVRLVALVAILATLPGVALEYAIATPEAALIRVGGILFSIAIAWALLSLPPRILTFAALAALAALAAHAQIEMTPVIPGATMWFFLLSAAVAAPAASPGTTTPRGGRYRVWAVALLSAFSLGIAIAHSVPTLAWEWHLRLAATRLGELPALRERLDRLARGTPQRGDSVQALARDLAADENPLPSLTPQGLASALDARRRTRLIEAAQELDAAVKAWPGHGPTLRARSRLFLQAAALSDTRADLIEQAIAFPTGTSLKPSAVNFAWLATAHRTAAGLTGDRSLLARSTTFLESAAELAPHNLTYARELAITYAQLDQPDAAAQWARRALAIHERLALDPLVQLSPTELATLQALADPAVAPPPGGP